MKKVFVQAATLLLVVVFTGTVTAQGTLLGGSSSGTAVEPVTKKISATNDGLTVDIKQGSIKYEFYATMADGSTSLVKSGMLNEPTDKTSVNDLALTKAGSAEVTLVLTAACDACASVTLKPDGSSPAEVSKELISTKDMAVVDVKVATEVDYELWVKTTPFSDFEKDEKQSGTIPAPKDMNLLNDIVLTAPDSYEIKVVISSEKGDSSATVSFKDK
jgi:hypothetical protein